MVVFFLCGWRKGGKAVLDTFAKLNVSLLTRNKPVPTVRVHLVVKMKTLLGRTAEKRKSHT